MVQVLSKMSPIGVTCHHYVHPWTDSCAEATAGLFLYAILGSARIYTTVYLLALLMKSKVPNKTEVTKTLKGILQSTAFLSFTAFGYSGFLCLLRKLMGNYNIVTISGLPAFLSSVFAILIERPSRRGLLALYVSNVATETVWNMLLYRGMVKNIKNGHVAIFSVSMAVLLALYKSGQHKRQGETHTDAIFNILRFIVGPHEEKDSATGSKQSNSIHRQVESDSSNEAAPESRNGGERWRRRQQNGSKSGAVYFLVMRVLKMYRQMVYKIKCCDRHPICPHPFSCLYYTLQGSTKMFSVGLGIQLALKLVFSIPTLIKSPKRITGVLFRRDNLNLAAFLGGASGIFRASMCLLRRATGNDDSVHAFISGAIAGVAFLKYPDTTVSLYVFWKMLTILYNIGIEKGYLPHIPGFTMFLYCFSTGLLFHAALVEPINLRPSYWKFLHSLSGGRVAVMNRLPMDVWGLETSQGLLKVMEKTKTKPVLSWFLIK